MSDLTIDLEFIAKVIGVLSVIAGTAGAMYKVLVRHLDKYLEKKLKPLDKWNERQQADIELAAERDAILMEAQLVSLEAIHENKNNGNVTKSIDKLRKYMLEHSSKPSSYAKGRSAE